MALLIVSALAVSPTHAGLVQRLEHGETVTVVALGDSLAAGMGLAQPTQEAYPAIFRSVLQRRYPRAHVRLVGAGIPGDTAEGGAGRVERDVLRYHPDLVVIQFGGNDHGRRRSPDEFRLDLHEIIKKVRAGSSAQILIATPPIISPETDTPMVRAVKEVAQAEALPLADFDQAIRDYGTGPRGPFPYARHPDMHLHGAMARALYGAFLRLLGEGEPLRISIAQGIREIARGVPVPVELQVHADQAGPVSVFLEHDGGREEQTVNAGPDAEATVRFALPPAPEGPPAVRRRLLAWARAKDAFAYDLRRLVATPVLPAAGGAGDLGRTGLVLGGAGWQGPEDLSATLSTTVVGENLRLMVEVRDSRLVRNLFLQGPHDSDCVEVHLDLRPTPAQARPYGDENVLCLLIRPGTASQPDVSWTSLEPLPADWKPSEVRGAPRPRRRDVEVLHPLALLSRSFEPGQESNGLDVAVDDADDDWGRKSQMVWAGDVDGFLDPTVFGALSLRAGAGAEPRRRVVVR